jgi:hypothetical protein
MEDGKQKGKKFKLVRCNVKNCRKEVKMVAGSTSGAVRHLDSAGRAGCKVHQAAYEEVIASSSHTNKIKNLDGSLGKKLTFMEQFPSHVAAVEVIAETSVSANVLRKPVVGRWIKTYEPGANPPAQETIRKIATCMTAVLVEKRNKKISRLKKKYRGAPCCSVQFDIWEDNQGRSWAAATWIYTDEVDGMLKIVSDVLWFGVFPYPRHTIPNIKAWILAILVETGLECSMILVVTPDGAADVQGAVRAIPELEPKLVTCWAHGLARAVVYATGMEGTENDEAKGCLKQHGRIAQLHNQSKGFRKSSKELQEADKIPYKKTSDANATRWNGRFSNMSRNNYLSMILSAALLLWKRSVRAAGASSVELYRRDALEDDDVASILLRDLGFDEDALEESYELEAVMLGTYNLTNFLQSLFHVTADQKMIALSRVIKQLSSPTVHLLLSVNTAKPRSRLSRDKDASKLGLAAKNFLAIMKQQLKRRFSDVRPADSMLIMLALSKQGKKPLETLSRVTWQREAARLLDAAFAAARQLDSRDPSKSPPRKKNKKKSSMFNDDSDTDFDDEEEEETSELTMWRNVPKSVC